MTSRDVHDVLNLPSDHSGVGRPSKKHKSSTARPNLKGLAREVQNLSGDNPIAIVPEVSFFKKRRIASRKPATRWELKPFMNSARADDGALVLRHWKRKTEDGPPADGEAQPAEDGAEANRMAKVEKLEDSAFAKYNVKAQIPQYTDDQYHSVLQSSTWTKEETDYLLELVRDFDLRWAIIWDRYDFQPKVEGVNGADTALVAASKPRTMEDLKARYYEISAKMMAVQTPVQYMTRPEFELYEMIQNFDPEQERKRKQFALNTMARSKDEAREEESLLLEVKRILARTERFNEERRELYNRLDYPATETDINSFKSSAGLQNLLQTLMTSDKAKKQRNKAMAPADGASPSSAVPPSAVSETAPNGHNRRESVAASAASAAHRDSDARTPATPAEPTPTTATNKKKGAPQPERRKLTQQEEQVYGVSYHDRLGSGPTFRYEKINKLYSHKSGQQQMRITNVLSELGIPPRLVMPTAQVTAQFELLWSAVTALVDLRKVSDRLDGEIKVEEAKKAERDKARGVVPPSNAEKGDGDRDKDKENEKDLAERSKVKEEEVGETPGLPGGDGDGGVEGGGGGGDGEGAENADGGENAKSVTDEPGEKQQEDEEGDKRPGSSGGASHKRSASVLSSVSDKSAKRQKK